MLLQAFVISFSNSWSVKNSSVIKILLHQEAPPRILWLKFRWRKGGYLCCVLTAFHAKSLFGQTCMEARICFIFKLLSILSDKTLPPHTASRALWNSYEIKKGKVMKTIHHTFKGLHTFVLLWATQAFSALGSSMTSYALVIWAYQQTGSALSTSLLTICSYAPYVLLSIFAGALSDDGTRSLPCWYVTVLPP